jgi:hypothetical protein
MEPAKTEEKKASQPQYKLPLRMKVTRVQKTAGGIEIDTVIEDAAGVSVMRKPITVGTQHTKANVAAILQSDINAMAAAMFKFKKVTAGAATDDGVDTELETLVGQEFLGSVVQ